MDDKNKKIVLSGAEKYTTNNKMELTATIKALKHLKDKSEIIIFTDSKYVIDGINNWIFKWKQNNWKTTNKKERQGAGKGAVRRACRFCRDSATSIPA